MPVKSAFLTVKSSAITSLEFFGTNDSSATAFRGTKRVNIEHTYSRMVLKKHYLIAMVLVIIIYMTHRE